MESTRVLIAREAPAVLFDQGTVTPSIHGEAASSSFFNPWTSLVADITQALSTLDLSGKSACRIRPKVKMTKALSVTCLGNLLFGDIHCVCQPPTLIPDVLLLSTSSPDLPRRDNTAAIAAGGIKTFWTFDLDNYRLPADDLTGLELPVGQLVGYMRMLKLRFGFLTTYKTTMFVRRMSDYRFEISDPINHLASAPSLRECFVGLSVVASENHQAVEQPGFRVEPVSSWPLSLTRYPRFDNEKTFYNTIIDQQPQRYPFFPSLLAFGEIITSSIMPSGHILILSEVPGENLSLISHNLNHFEWNIVREQCRRAIAVLRRLEIYLQDCGPHNVLFSRSTGRVTLIEFEYYAACREDIPASIEAPELRSILGRERRENYHGN